MIELKIARAGATVYRAVLRLSIKLIDMRDRRNHRRYYAAQHRAETMEAMAATLFDEAADLRDYSNDTLDSQNHAVGKTRSSLKEASAYLTTTV